ncbi:hedgehog/intein domain containing protein [Cellulophaga phage phi40:1]|uniref:3'-phosphate/5'-hydroxy nucleic acid ligase n=1 Tax=Cellulophaga phage phi38:1 TaxID=1327977 RepID=R9ZZW9_9CAUD|nr:tRNA splicing ligase [Cellulophaga phage phi38:1]AGO47895.1 hedgehog/intein domain containing protein [Cellulophaga phage phi40:1]AGO48060.1 hedgehog/intein domain containing protein [Cellulophaga phage phi38:1]
MVTGKTLIELGYKPSKWFGEAIDELNAQEKQFLKILGRRLTDDEIVFSCNKYLPPPTIGLHKNPVSYTINILPTNEKEQDNVDLVKMSMDSLMKTPTIVDGTIMPDACPTGKLGQIPVGSVVVTKNAIHPGFHSADICCSVYATEFAEGVKPKDVMDIAFETTQFGPGGRRGLGGWSSILDGESLLTSRIEENYFTKDYIEKARMHMGTQGDGNHFLFVGVSEATGRTMMVTHHGSRGFGSSVYKKGMHTAERFRKQLSPKTDPMNAWIPFEEKEGELYWEALQILREWTKLNHSSIHNRVANKLKTTPIRSFWNEHNFVFKDGDKFYHAKGATPLDDKFVPDSTEGLRLIPLNMAEPILIVKGKTTRTNLGFAPHGAGRNVSRAAHKRSMSAKSNPQIFKDETAGLDIRFFSGEIDISELPSAYKNADTVQDQMESFGLGDVLDKIMPYGSIMAGDYDRFKPWKKK